MYRYSLLNVWLGGDLFFKTHQNIHTRAVCISQVVSHTVRCFLLVFVCFAFCVAEELVRVKLAYLKVEVLRDFCRSCKDFGVCWMF